jgi:hypothetical protein
MMDVYHVLDSEVALLVFLQTISLFSEEQML